ncbi:hypothetical protein [Gulosibacter faecalis]|uniref:hypothetical protein n=1 Tax=Gulosibacter faecalis TaxID=272240 RepID=UPI0012B5ED5C|nr:hypothetical protein [Gulosibacter faecalis]
MGWLRTRRQTTGVRDVTSLSESPITWARLLRSVDNIDLYLQNVNDTPANQTIMTLPPGFRPGWTRRLTSSAATGYGYVDQSGRVRHSTAITSPTIIYGLFTTANPFPDTDPGVPG